MNYDLERQLKHAFRSADLPLAPDRLRQVLIELPASGALADRSKPRAVSSRTLLHQGLRLAAALALFAAVSGVVLYGISNLLPQVGPRPSESPSPTTQASPTPTTSTATTAPSTTAPLRQPAALLSQYPDALVAFERSVGPADRPLSEGTTLDEIDLGPLEFARDIVLAAACLGPGELTVEVRYTNLPGAADPFVGLARPCNGEETAVRYTGAAATDEVEMQVIAVHVPDGASWRFAIGEIPDPSAAPQSFAPISGTEDWWRLWDLQLDSVDPSTGMGVGVRVADDVTLIGLWVECADSETVILDVVHDSPSPTADLSMPIACAAGETERHEMPVAAREEISVTVTPTSPIAIHLYVEANAMPVSEWGEPPALPSELADAPFMASNGSHVTLGSLGATRQALVAVAGAGPLNRPGGDYAAIAVNALDGSSIRLYSISSGEELTTLAEHEPGSFINTSWVDVANEQVFYTVISPSTQELQAYRVRFNGNGETRLTSVPLTGALSTATLSLDLETFVVHSCQEHTCQRTIVDTATLDIQEATFSVDAEVCDVAGVTDDVVVLRVAESCTTTPPEQVLVLDFDAEEILRIPDPGFVSLVRTTDGPALLLRGLTDGGLQVTDIADGSSSPVGVDDSTLALALGVQLPPNWVLLAPFSGIGDFPLHPSILLGNAPLLVDVITGETIELVNLPH